MKWLNPWLEKRWHAFTRVFWAFAPQGIVGFLPGTSRNFGPARRRTVWSHYVERYPATWRTAYEPRQQTLPEPFYCNDPKYTWRSAQENNWPEFGVAEIPHGRLLDENGWVVGAHDQHVRDLDLPAVPGVYLMNQIIKLHPIRRLPGRTLNLSTIFGVRNFYHHVIDGLSRAQLVERAGYIWDDFDQVILSRFNSPMAEKVEKAAGIPENKIVRLGRRDHVECDVLAQPSYPGRSAHTPWWVGEYYRNIMPPPNGGPRKRIYIPRGGSRNPTELHRIEKRLGELGFETINPLSLNDLHEKLAFASHVVSIHGAALANLILCRPGTRLLELIPSDLAYGNFSCYYYTLCAALDMPYGVLVGQTTTPRKFSFSPQSESSYDIKWSDFEEGLAKLLENG